MESDSSELRFYDASARVTTAGFEGKPTTDPGLVDDLLRMVSSEGTEGEFFILRRQQHSDLSGGS